MWNGQAARRSDRGSATTAGIDNESGTPIAITELEVESTVREQQASVAGTLRSAEEVEAALALLASGARNVASGTSWDDVVARIADALVELIGFDDGAVYVPGNEAARWDCAGRATIADGDRGGRSARVRLAPHVRVDRGLVADAIAGERAMHVRGREQVTAMGYGDGSEASVVVLPLRDARSRPVGVVVAISSRDAQLSVAQLALASELGAVAEGVLSAATDRQRLADALESLPDLAEVAARDDGNVAGQLDSLVRIAAWSCDCDAAVLRLWDERGDGLETVAAYSRNGDPVSDLIGSRTPRSAELPPEELGAQRELDAGALWAGLDIEGWSPAARRMVGVLGARGLAVHPISSLHGRDGALYLLRTTARPFDELTTACARIIAAHLQHVVDRSIVRDRAERATEAARSAIQLLGEGLVAGVRAERTLRFVPRLFHEMFETRWCRVWRREPGEDGRWSLVAAAGSPPRSSDGDAPTGIVAEALGTPLVLRIAHHDDEPIAAVSFDEWAGVRIAVEAGLAHGRLLGPEEQRLIVDVAARVAEALYSAGQGAAHGRQLELVRSLQEVIAQAHEQLSQSHVVATVADLLPEIMGASGLALFAVGNDGRLDTLASRDVPPNVLAAIEQLPSWVPDASPADDRSSVLTIDRLGGDERMGAYATLVEAHDLADTALVAVPLTAREQTIGVVVLLFDQGIPVGVDTESATLPAFGGHVGSALLNAREFERERAARSRVDAQLEEEREYSRQLRALHEVSSRFAESLKLDETMRAVVKSMADRLDVDAVWIRTPDERGQSMELRAFYGSHPELREALERMVTPPDERDDPLTNHVMRERQSVLVTKDDLEAGAWAGAATLRRLEPFLDRGSSVAVLPLAIPNSASGAIGTLTMLSIDPASPLDYDTVADASTVASQAALALDNARLSEQQRQFKEMIEESVRGRLPTPRAGLDFGEYFRPVGDGFNVGGDFFDFLELDDGRIAMALGDVTGKGLDAAADTLMTKYIFRALAREHPSPANFLKFANEVICEEITTGKFVTLFYGVIDPVRKTITCGSAGHPDSKIMRMPGSPGVTGSEPEIESLAIEGLALGILTDQDYEQREYAFEAESYLVVYTDGVVESRRDGRLYGQYRLERRISEEAGVGAYELAFSIYQDCVNYADHGLQDDVAIVVVHAINESGGTA